MQDPCIVHFEPLQVPTMSIMSDWELKPKPTRWQQKQEITSHHSGHLVNRGPVFSLLLALFLVFIND